MKNHCYISTTLSILKIKKMFKQKNKDQMASQKAIFIDFKNQKFPEQENL